MSYADGAFRTLGLEETDDVRAIKRAYAAKLKAINPDDDIAGFQALRNALSTATEYARYLAARAQEGAGDDADEDDDFYDYDEDNWSPPILTKTRAADGDGAQPAWDADAELAAQTPYVPTTEERLIAALQAEQQAFPDRPPFESDVSDAVQAAYDALLADPAHETVDGQEELERWLAQVLPYYAPWSDGLIWRASYHFGWHAELDKAYPNWAFATAARRARDVGVVVQLLQPDDPGHAAFMTLRSDTPLEQLSAEAKLQAADLLARFQVHTPQVQAVFNPERLELLQEFRPVRDISPGWSAAGISWWMWLAIGGMFLNAIIRLIGSL